MSDFTNSREAKEMLLEEMIRVMAKIIEPETKILDWATGSGVLEIESDAEGWLRHSMDGSSYLIVRWKRPAPELVICPCDCHRPNLPPAEPDHDCCPHGRAAGEMAAILARES
jgi:hypothetical protein